MNKLQIYSPLFTCYLLSVRRTSHMRGKCKCNIFVGKSGRRISLQSHSFRWQHKNDTCLVEVHSNANWTDLV